MLDINLIRENPEKVKEGIKKKNIDESLVDKFLEVDEEWRSQSTEFDNLKAEQNKISKKISSGGKDDDLIKQAKELKEKLSEISEKEKTLNEERMNILSQIPNIPSEKALVGKGEEDNKVIRTVGDKPKFDFEPKDYMEIGESLGIIDMKRAAEISGSRFSYLLGKAALLEFGLVQLAMETLVEKGFKPIVPPVMVKPEIMQKMGKGKFLEENDAFYVNEDNLYMAGSSEHTIGPFHMNEVLRGKDLPIRYIGFSTCFRREAGSYGKDTKGILRVHQFDKAEMFSITTPDKSEEEHEFLVSCQEQLLQKLELPYQVLEVCTGDMTWADSRQYDLETWIPSQNKYRETNSASNTTDFQSRGVNIKYDKGGSTEFVHMLNATAFAMGRILIALIENHQTKEGTIIIPKSLQKYVNFEEITL
ncbi:MAG: serine--tRNA ligase [Candidatus Paceibacterota bacterium]